MTGLQWNDDEWMMRLIYQDADGDGFVCRRRWSIAGNGDDHAGFSCVPLWDVIGAAKRVMMAL